MYIYISLYIYIYIQTYICRVSDNLVAVEVGVVQGGVALGVGGAHVARRGRQQLAHSLVPLQDVGWLVWELVSLWVSQSAGKQWRDPHARFANKAI